MSGRAEDAVPVPVLVHVCVSDYVELAGFGAARPLIGSRGEKSVGDGDGRRALEEVPADGP